MTPVDKVDPMKLSKAMHSELDDMVDEYMGDCACEESTQCNSCRMKTDLLYASIRYACDYQRLAVQKCIKIAEDAMDRQLVPHYAEAIVTEIRALLGKEKK
jgi:hypothetical protein